MYVYRNQYESKPTEESLSTFHTNIKRHTITISRSWIKRNWNVHIIDVIRKIRIVQSLLNDNYSGHSLHDHFSIHIGNETSMCMLSDPFTFAHVVVEGNDFSFSQANWDIFAYGPTSFGLIHVSNTVFYKTWVQYHQTGGLVAFYFDNCTFSGIDDRGIYLPDTVQVNITNCQFTLKDDAKCIEGGGCAVNVKGIDYKHRYFFLANILFFPTRTCYWVLPDCLSTYVENSVFVGSAGASGGALSCMDMNLALINCKFSLTKKCKPAALGGFLNCKCLHKKLFGTNVTFHISTTQHSSLVSINAGEVKFKNVHMMCPNSMGVVEEALKFGDWAAHYHYKCGQHCKDDEYTYEAGSMILQGESWPKYEDSDVFPDAYPAEPSSDLYDISWMNLPNNTDIVKLSYMTINPTCIQCPLGANCVKDIRALPNYWGYKNQSDVIGGSRGRRWRPPNRINFFHFHIHFR